MLITIYASQVEEGDFIPGLDNGYVFENPDTDNIPPMYDGRYAVARSGDNVSISFHTANGDEAQLICPADMMLTVERRVPENGE